MSLDTTGGLDMFSAMSFAAARFPPRTASTHFDIWIARIARLLTFKWKLSILEIRSVQSASLENKENEPPDLSLRTSGDAYIFQPLKP
jgi:hypothetical protein